MKIWQALVDWVSTRGPDHQYTETGAADPPLPVPAAADVFERRSRLAKPHLLCLSGWIVQGIQAWLVFSVFTPVWFIVSQKDIQSQAELDVFTHAIAALGRHLGHGLSVAHEWDIPPACGRGMSAVFPKERAGLGGLMRGGRPLAGGCAQRQATPGAHLGSLPPFPERKKISAQETARRRARSPRA